MMKKSWVFWRIEQHSTFAYRAALVFHGNWVAAGRIADSLDRFGDYAVVALVRRARVHGRFPFLAGGKCLIVHLASFATVTTPIFILSVIQVEIAFSGCWMRTFPPFTRNFVVLQTEKSVQNFFQLGNRPRPTSVTYRSSFNQVHSWIFERDVSFVWWSNEMSITDCTHPHWASHVRNMFEALNYRAYEVVHQNICVVGRDR